MPPSPSSQTPGLMDLGSKILFMVVPVACAWIIKLEVGNAEQDLRLQQLQERVAESKLQVKDITDIKVEIGMLQVKQDSLSAKIDKLYGALIVSGGTK